MFKPISDVWRSVIEKMIGTCPSHQSKSLDKLKLMNHLSKVKRRKKRWQKVKETIEKYDV